MRSIATDWRTNQFSVLFVALLLFFIAGPIYQVLLNQLVVQSVTVILFAMIFIAALRATESAQRWRPVLIVLGMLAIALLVVAITAGTISMMIAFYCLNLLFLAAIAALTIGRLLRSRSANYETIAASLCGYLLLIMLWANTYSLVDTVTTGSFAYAVTGSEGAQLMRFALGDAMLSLYYSFVTMTTLGYGDVLPVSPMARVLAATQAFVGQVYIAILVARLVGLEIAERATITK